MDGWRIGRLVIVAGAVAMVAGARGETGGLALPLLILGLATWHRWAWGRGKHFRAWGLGKLVAMALLALLALGFTQHDFRDGTPELNALEWVGIAALPVVLIGVLWSFVELIWWPERRSRVRTPIP